MLAVATSINRVMGRGDPIAALFRPAGRTGWRYPLTLDTLFQDAAGTTPVTAPGDPVGRVLDTSGKGNHRTQSTALNRPTYQLDDDGLPYLAYNGSNSSMATASFAWGSDKATVCVGVRKNNNTRGMFLESSTGLLDGSFNIECSAPTGTENYNLTSKGTTNRSTSLATFTAPITNVVTMLADIAAPSLIGRVNGAQINSIVSSQGTGNFGTHAIFWGTRGSGGLFFNGREYPSIGINAVSNEITALFEPWVTARTGALG